MSDALQVDGLSKRYRLGTDPAGYDTLRDAITRAFRGRRTDARYSWALEDVTFTVPEGQTLGIIGHNGAGKTTLLKILAGITDPTRGEVRIKGRVGALLEVGTGLHPELTGRENIYLMGALLGLRRNDVRRLFDEIVDFSGLSGVLETPVKRYSPGMRLRLAFSTAAHIQPPIVVLDEVLAVGDAEFRERCLLKVAELGGSGRTVLFVSHDIGAVSRLCRRVIWIEEGRLHTDGPAEDLIPAYLEASVDRPTGRKFDVGEEGRAALLREVRLVDAGGAPLESVRRDRPFAVDISFEVREPVLGLDVSLWFRDENGTLVIHDVRSDQLGSTEPIEAPGLYRVRVHVPQIFAARRYTLGVWLGNDHETFFGGEALGLSVLPHPDDRQAATDRPRVVQPDLEWTLISRGRGS